VIDGHGGSIGLHEKSRESLPEMPRESICLNGYDESHNPKLHNEYIEFTQQARQYALKFGAVLCT